MAKIARLPGASVSSEHLLQQALQDHSTWNKPFKLRLALYKF